MFRAFISLMLLAISAPLAAQEIVISSQAEDVSLTIYRDPARGIRPINANWPSGYALITETRTVSIPAGESLIRFEGVAEGMYPESAIVTGLPQGVSEKNRDARLLSPAGLVDAYLKREVNITRTNKATGKTTQAKALITTGPNGIILQTDAGYEALRCSGLPERLSFDRLPKDLSAKPTLSIITKSERPITAKLTLTYMAGGFDWEANYLLQMKDKKPETAEDKKRPASLFAWLTLANGGNQSFNNANTMAVAGSPNRERRKTQARPTGTGLKLRCWPMQRTDQVPFRGLQGFRPVPAPQMMSATRAEYEDADIIVVTGSRMKRKMAMAAPVAAIKAEQEDLGDLKLYRIPERVNVNAKGQKQVAMITKPNTKFEQLYTITVDAGYNVGESDNYPMDIILRSKNSKAEGLGLPLPSGQIQIFENSSYGPLLASETNLSDKTIDEKFEVKIGSDSDVQMGITKVAERNNKQYWKVTISNALDHPINAEVKIPYALKRPTKAIRKIDGIPTWHGTIAANDEVTFQYYVKMK